jgi:tetratricopeptide (TPR) repeat protein
MENPYNEFNKSDRETMGFGDPTSGLKDSLSMCYDLLDDKDKDLRPIIGSLAEQNPGNEEIQYISAKNHMNLGNYARAIEGFSKLRSSDTYELMDQARYYYSLISVYLDNKDQSAIALLEEISNDKKSEFQKLAVDVIAFL